MACTVIPHFTRGGGSVTSSTVTGSSDKVLLATATTSDIDVIFSASTTGNGAGRSSENTYIGDLLMASVSIRSGDSPPKTTIESAQLYASHNFEIIGQHSATFGTQNRLTPITRIHLYKGESLYIDTLNVELSFDVIIYESY